MSAAVAEDHNYYSLKKPKTNKKNAMHETNNLTPLHVGVHSNENPAIIRELLNNNKVKINAMDEEDKTPLHYAIFNNSLIMSKILISCGADVNQRDKEGKTFLHFAALNVENIGIIRLLLQEYKNDGDPRDSAGRTPLHWVASNNKWVASDNKSETKNFNNINLAVIKIFLDNGFDINAKDREGLTPLHWAVGNSENLKMIKALLDGGADIRERSKKGVTPLHLAAKYSESPAVIKLLLKEPNVNVNARVEAGGTPLHWAVAHNKEPMIIEALLKGGADASLKDFTRKTAFDYFYYIKKNAHKKKIKSHWVYWDLREASKINK